MVITEYIMPVLRNRFAEVRSGGPRQFSEMRDRVMIRASSFEDQSHIVTRLKEIGFEGEEMDSSPVIVARPRDGFGGIIDAVSDSLSEEEQQQAREEVVGQRGLIDVTEVTIRITQEVISRIRDIPGVGVADFAFSYADYGPENLRLSINEMDTIDLANAEAENETLQEANESFNLPDVWEEETGDQSIVAIFDTGFSRGLIDENRIVDTFHSDDVDSVYESSEGHGTMTAGAAAASNSGDRPYNGAAPESDVILVRITNSEGQIGGDIISEAWDHLINLNMNKPIVANHSYGTPLCSGRPRTRFCDKPQNELIEVAVSDSNITSVYAAGNEAMQCGHRPSGLTNAITGTNSLSSVITVGALRLDGIEAQRYSSHGRGDCSPVADPKPNVSCSIPMKTYYGAEDGWEIKDMSTGVGGSSGGTSHAAPTVAGMVALMQSKAVKERGSAMQTEEIKQIIQNTADLPHSTPVNRLGIVLSQRGYDARFGHGQINIVEALDQI